MSVAKPKLTVDDILERVTDDQIFRYYLSGRWQIGGVMSSPFRKDRNPSFSVRRNGRGSLTFIDYAKEEDRGNCITLVMKMFDLNYNDALEKIDYDFNLGIRFPKQENKNLILPKPLPIQINKPKDISIIAKPYDNFHSEYWIQQIGLTSLEEKRVYAVDKYFINGKEGFRAQNERIFCYDYPDIRTKNYSCKKLYFVDRKEMRWRSSLPNSYIEWNENLDYTKPLRLTKSKKDRLLLTGILHNISNIQSENSSFLIPENLAKIKLFPSTDFIADNDQAGRKQAEFLNKEHGFNPIFYPEKEAKDSSEYFQKNNRQQLISYLRKNIK